VSFLSVIGDDWEGSLLRRSLEEHRIATDGVLTQASRSTLTKHRLIAASQMLLRFDQGSTNVVGLEAEQGLIDSLCNLFHHCHALVISDYGYGILTPRVMQAIAHLQSHSPQLIVADAKNLARYRNVGVTVVKPNYEEALRLLPAHNPSEFTTQEMAGTRADYIASQGQAILDITGAQMAVVTLDAEGAVVLQRDRPPEHIDVHPPAAGRSPHLYASTTGAGDTFISALTLAIAAGVPVTIAAEVATAAAAIVVGKDGTATCSAEELSRLSQTQSVQIPRGRRHDPTRPLESGGKHSLYQIRCDR
jgi:D-beta-D-heptose 7-phosphate kinase/D-beta-D-heptose 1-phosphate adenosyltransferase